MLIGKDGVGFLEICLRSLDEILPHTTTEPWRVTKGEDAPAATWDGNTRRGIRLVIRIQLNKGKQTYSFVLKSTLRRKIAASLGSAVERTLDDNEKSICSQVVIRASDIIGSKRNDFDAESLRAIGKLFKEQVVASHLRQSCELNIDVAGLFATLRELAEQSYENKSLSYGLVISKKKTKQTPSLRFPIDFLRFKRYRAMSDGYRTAFTITANGKVESLDDLEDLSESHHEGRYYPEWCRFIAEASCNARCSISLTRQGDILVFVDGSMRFTYRRGKWQYWNHRHAENLLTDSARAKHVDTRHVKAVVRQLYKSAIDVSFRRTGGLFILLCNKIHLRKIVPQGDAIKDKKRERAHVAFDKSLADQTVASIPRLIRAELAALDGAIVVDNRNKVLAYGAVLKSPPGSKVDSAEGSRSKAAKAASEFGLAIKVSSDGDITIYRKGITLLEL